MPGFPTLSPLPQRPQGRGPGRRISQRDILPTATRRRHQLPQERETVAIVALTGDVGDFTDIQSALNLVNSLGGGNILVKPGTYSINQPLIVYSNTSISGVNSFDVILDFQNSTINNFRLVDSAREIKISDMTFNNCHNVTEGTIYGNRVAGVQISRLDFNKNVNSSGNGYDMRFVNSSGGVVVRDCDSGDGGTFFFSDGMSGSNKISGGQISRSNDRVFVDVSQTEISNVLIEDPTKSIFFGNFAFSKILGNVTVFGSATLTEPLGDFNGSDHMYIAHNYFDTRTGADTIFDLNASISNKIVGNTLWGNEASTPVILLTNDSGFNTITGNDIDGETGGAAGMDGIQITNSDANVITGNVIFGSVSGTAYGVNITDSGSSNTLVVGNVLQANTADTNNSGTSSTIANNN